MSDSDAEPTPIDDFADYAHTDAELGPTPNWAALRRPGGLIGPSIAVAGLSVLLAPGAIVPIGVALVVVVSLRLLQGRHGAVRGVDLAVQVITTATAVLVGGALLLWPEPTSVVLGLLVGGYLTVNGLAAIMRARAVAVRARWPVISGTLKAVFGVTVLARPQAVASFAVLAIGLGWLATGTATTLLTVRDGRPITPRMLDRVLPEWLDRRVATSGDRNAVQRKLFFEGDDAQERLGRFFALMGFASTIAVCGIVIDSTAVVVGAMLVAPLITPLMGTSAAVVTGWPRRAARSGLIALAGGAIAILVAFVFTAWLPGSIDLEQNTQITARIAPTLVDLLIALAAGGAGAFATSRPDVSDALPGVAVAIALVPPLTVVGATAQAGAPGLALGAMLLFAANAVGILVAGGVVFVLTGFTPMRRITQQRQWIREATATVAMFGLFVFAVLAVTNSTLLFPTISIDDARPVIDVWAGDDYDVVSVTVDTDAVDVVVAGPTEPATTDQLADTLAADLQREVDLTVQWTPRATFQARGAPPD